MNIIIRIIASPFVFCIAMISRTFNAFYITYLFIRYGGEWLTYKKEDKARISSIYEELVKQQGHIDAKQYCNEPFERAYGADEPDYNNIPIRNPNPDYKPQ
jgi:hypothetical protein